MERREGVEGSRIGLGQEIIRRKSTCPFAILTKVVGRKGNTLEGRFWQ